MRLAPALAAVVLLGTVTACGGDDEPRVHVDDDVVACDDTLIVQVVINKGGLTPRDEARSACVDQEIELIVSADASGSLKVKGPRTRRFPYTIGQQSVHLRYHRTGTVVVTDQGTGLKALDLIITDPIDGSPSPLPTPSGSAEATD